MFWSPRFSISRARDISLAPKDELVRDPRIFKGLGRIMRLKSKRLVVLMPIGVSFIVASSLLLSGVFGINKVGKAVQIASKPNIIFILVDDMGRGDLSCYGQTLFATPHLDIMAAEGARFTSFYTGCPVCAPARCSLMTGLNMGHAYIRTNTAPPPDLPLRPEDLTVAELLQKQGYHNGMIGKWGLGGAGSTGDPNNKGFPDSYGFYEHSEGNYYPSWLWRNRKKESVPEGSYQEDLFTAEALKFISTAKQPFFLYLAYMVPHAPYVSVPGNSPSFNEQPWQQLDRNYAAMITRLDLHVGQILALLEQNGLDQDTIVFFSSDNGPEDPNNFFHSAGPLRGFKRTLYEGGIRMPGIVRWTQHIRPGQVVSEPFAFYDFLPTAAQLSGADIPVGTDGLSMLGTLLGNEQEQHRFLYWEFPIKNTHSLTQAVRLGNWKGVRVVTQRKRKRKEQFNLYDLSADLAEANDLADQFPEVVQTIRSIMIQQHTPPAALQAGGHGGHE
jgi:arylsulfatase A